MIGLLRVLNKPEYLFRPQAIARRIRSGDASGHVLSVPLPWGISIEVDGRETIGRSLRHRGLFEMAVVETLFRLIDPGDLVLDVGANIGFMAAAAACSQRDVAVVAFEPHPGLFLRLTRNRDAWVEQRSDMAGRIRLVSAAVSDRTGVATLHIPNGFGANQGIASLVPAATSDRTAVTVDATTIDTFLAAEGHDVGLLKIDIEGHELAALQGASEAFQRGAIRDIVFEDYGGADSEVCRLLAGHGYAIYFLAKLPWGPQLFEGRHASRAALLSFDSPNYLATREPKRAKARMAGLGYRCTRATRD